MYPGLLVDGTRRYLALIARTLVPGRHGCSRPTLRHYALALPLLLLLPIAAAYHWLGLLLDEVLFRGYRRVEVREPVFVLGVPRSGTTALHHVLAEDPQFTTLRTWECLFATSVSWRWLWWSVGRVDRRLGGFARRGLERLERVLLDGLNDVHAVTLDSPEEDYLALLPALGCFVLMVLAPDAGAIWRLGRFDADLDEGERRRLMALYRGAVQRHLYFHGSGRRFLAKNASFAPAAASLLEAFPDARVLACLREPAGAVASQLDAVDPAIAALHGRYRREVLCERIVAMFDFHYRHLLEVLGRADDDHAVLIPSGALRRDMGATIVHAYRQLGLALTPTFAARLAAPADGGSGGGSRHDLGRFGTTRAAVQQRFADVSAAFDFDATEAVRPRDLAGIAPATARDAA